MLLIECCDPDRPTWVANVVARLQAAGYTVSSKYDGDGTSWQNILYTVTKDGVTYRQDVRAQLLLTLSFG